MGPPARPKPLAAFLLLLVVAIWGSTFALVKDALQDASPLLFNFLRMLIASAALLLINWRRLRDVGREPLLAGAIAGLLLGLGYQLQTAGLALTSAANSAFITGLVVVFVPILSTFPFLRSPQIPAPRWTAAIGACLAFAGFYRMTTTGSTALVGMLGSLHTGDVLTLGCALAFAAHLLSLAHFARVPAPVLATLQVSMCTLLMALTLPLGGRIYLHLTPRLLLALLITGLLATAFAFAVQSWAQQQLPAGTVALLLTLEPVFALLVSTALLGEHPGRRSLTGAGLILAGIAVTEAVGRPLVPLPPEPI